MASSAILQELLPLVCVCTYVTYSCGNQRPLSSAIFFYHPLPYLKRQALSLNKELAGSARLAGQQTLRSSCLHLLSTANRAVHCHIWPLIVNSGSLVMLTQQSVYLPSRFTNLVLFMFVPWQFSAMPRFLFLSCVSVTIVSFTYPSSSIILLFNVEFLKYFLIDSTSEKHFFSFLFKRIILLNIFSVLQDCFAFQHCECVTPPFSDLWHLVYSNEDSFISALETFPYSFSLFCDMLWQ